MAGSSPAKGSLVVYGSLETTDFPQPDSRGLSPGMTKNTLASVVLCTPLGVHCASGAPNLQQAAEERRESSFRGAGFAREPGIHERQLINQGPGRCS